MTVGVIRVMSGMHAILAERNRIRAPDPEAALMDFLIDTYEAAANAGKWDRASLECPIGRPGIPRPV